VACLPTRVIYVGQDNLNIRLHISESGQKDRYAALSHCWGGSNPLITTTDNVVSHVENLPYESLPHTFRDAILVARALGLEYLWIDSLCILQNSVEDWTNEAARMANVYQNAYVTISADAAVDCHSGFLEQPARTVGPSGSVPYELKNVLGGTWKGIMHVREKGPLMRQLPVHGWHPGTIITQPPLQKKTDSIAPIPSCLMSQDEAPASKLSTRGWVLQERLLSPRTLYFGPSELGWECRTCIKCECTATSTRSRRGQALLKRVLVHQDWAKLVKEYTRLHLTVPQDRLPAISGLALAMYRLQTNRYFSGLWESSLAHDLMWHVDSHLSSPQVRFDAYYAPTWSWAHLIAPVSYRYLEPGDVERKLEILEISYAAGVLNPFGPPLAGAFIRVEGFVADITITSLDSGLNAVEPWGEDVRVKWYPRIRAILDDNHVPLPNDQPVFFLMARVVKNYGLDGLLLRTASGNHDDPVHTFERFGYGYALSGEIMRRRRRYSSDSSSASEDETFQVPAWSFWESVATRRELKII
jgi:hypothetical protein